MIPRKDSMFEDFRRMDAGIRVGFTKVKEEMDQHLDAINGNTNELQACYEYLAELDAKLEKVSERLDELQFRLEPETAFAALDEVVLSRREQEVFLVLYALEEPVTTNDVARRLGLADDMVERSFLALAAKGVPILKTLVDGSVFHSLDLKFKDVQARKNVLQISESVRAQLLTEKAI